MDVPINQAKARSRSSRKNASIHLIGYAPAESRDAAAESSREVSMYDAYRTQGDEESCTSLPPLQREAKGKEKGSLSGPRKNLFLSTKKVVTWKGGLALGSFLLLLHLLQRPASSSPFHAEIASEDWSAVHMLSAEPFELYSDFDISKSIIGNEGWWDLVRYRRDITSPSLAFYVDKVAQKRWLPSIGISTPKPFVIKYASELSESGSQEEEAKALENLLPKSTSYAAKPSHTSCSDGVWLVKHDKDSSGAAGNTFIGKGGNKFKKVTGGDATTYVSEKLAEYLHEKPREMESVALKLVKPGVVVEERYTSWDSDYMPAIEFKVFIIWGRVLFAQWRRGNDLQGLIRRDGSVVEWYWKKKRNAASAIPSWVDWDHVIDVAERLGAHKDMFRVDVFAGIPSGLLSQREDASEQELKAAVQIVVSECEVHPTTERVDKALYEEAARLWIAGYKIGNYRLVPNSEVPDSFSEGGLLSSVNAMQTQK